MRQTIGTTALTGLQQGALSPSASALLAVLFYDASGSRN